VTHRILVIDDEPAVRRALERVLRSMEFEVVTAGDPSLAYELLGSQEFDLVLLDINLPHMSGDALFLALVRRAPELARRVRLMSGDPWAVQSDWPADLRECPMLIKPFSLESLGRIVQSALAAAVRASPRRKRNGG
jgi:DNA-binding NtrC family response regulator